MLYSKTICAFSVFPFNFSLNKVSICSCGCQPADILILWSPVLMYSSFLQVSLLPFSEKPICFWHLLTTVIFYELPGKNPFRDAVTVNCSVKILHLACLTACNLLTFVVSMPLNKIFFFFPLLLYKATLVFLRQQHHLIQSNNHYWIDHPAHEVGTNAVLIWSVRNSAETITALLI